LVTVAQRMASEHVHAIVVLRETVDAEGATDRRPWGIQHTSHAVVVEPRTDRPVGVLSTLDIAGILGWGRG
jgi:hypothetical protein